MAEKTGPRGSGGRTYAKKSESAAQIRIKYTRLLALSQKGESLRFQEKHIYTYACYIRR